MFADVLMQAAVDLVTSLIKTAVLRDQIITYHVSGCHCAL